MSHHSVCTTIPSPQIISVSFFLRGGDSCTQAIYKTYEKKGFFGGGGGGGPFPRKNGQKYMVHCRSSICWDPEEFPHHKIRQVFGGKNPLVIWAIAVMFMAQSK